MPHLLLIGATGMLEGVAVEFAGRGWTVTAVARRAGPLQALVEKAAGLRGRIIALPADYADPEFGSILAAGIRANGEQNGPPTACAAWIHSTAPGAPLIAARALAETPGRVDFVHIFSRLRTLHPRDRSTPIPFDGEADIRAIPNLTYRQAILGWVVEPQGPRWLTHDEIARGVVGAIDSRDPVTGIGWTEPIGSNPGRVRPP